MAFLSNRMKTCESEINANDNVSYLDETNVRVLLFKEYGVEGRKLIFDSLAIDCLSHGISNISETSSIHFQKIIEMVFGSVSLRCHETYFRIHNLSSPNRIMFTQVFPFPGSKRIEFCALDPHLSSTVKNIFNLETVPDDVASRNSSHSFDIGMQFDQQILHDQLYVPNSSTSTIDSGYVEQSISSFILSNRSSFNSGLSLNHSQNKIRRTETNTFSSELDNYSSENVSTKALPTLGLVIVLAVTSRNKDTKSCMPYATFIQYIIFRIRQKIGIIFNNPSVLLSALVEISYESTQWLTYMVPDLQKCNSYEMNSAKNSKLNSHSEIIHNPFKSKIAKMFKINQPKFSFLRSTIFTKEAAYDTAENFNEFCELLETLETKETNFFLSTIITATLTYHLGWITTCFSCSSSSKDLINISSYNSLWRQTTELYGALGCPIKSAQTIINGSNQNDIISKIIHFIQYFIRCSTVVHNYLERINVFKDNETADTICLTYKSSRNYLTEPSMQQVVPANHIKSRLHKSKVCMSDLSELLKEEEYEKNYLQSATKVTFILGENEELINLKPNLPSTGSSKKNYETTTLDSSNMKSVIKHSNSAFHGLCEPTNQKHLETINVFNNEHSKSKSLNINEEEVLELDNNYEMATRNCDLTETHKHIYRNAKQRKFNKISKMKILSFPLPSSKLNNILKATYQSTLKSDTVGKYVPDMVVQGISITEKDWILKLKKDLYLTRQIYFFDGFVDESLAIFGDVDKWDVEIISSCTRINRKSIGMKLDISSLVANMLEVLLQMWNLRFCRKYSITHIEQRLLEICIRSYALGQLLLHTEMCTMDLLTATLHLEVNDMPLLMSVASVISSQVTKKYGLSFQ